MIIGIVGTPFEETERVILGYEGRTTGTRTTYEDAVIKAGGTPILLTPLKNEAGIVEQLNLVDGIILQGGGGDNETEKIHTEYIKKAYQKNLSILGICMGLQLINTTLGGKIERIKTGNKHKQQTPLFEVAHNIKVNKNSKLFKILKKENIMVNSNHKYAITELGKGVLITAISDDDVIEAVEVPYKKFIVGVQWHPEHLVKKNEEWLKLFIAFVDSCM